MNKTILTVDDASTMRKMIGLTLKTAGYDVLEAPDGPEALVLLANHQIDLMLYDVNMPKMNGIELLKHTRRNPRFLSTPVLMLTTETQSEIKNQAKAAGATGWITKPFKQNDLVEAVGKVLSLSVAA